jgi:DNA-binding SARP family transcriptional activator
VRRLPGRPGRGRRPLQDDFLAGFTLKGSAEFDTWQTFTTESLRLELAAALEKLAGALAARGQTDQALPHARRWLALDPLHEASHRLLMQLHAAAGDRAALARQYRQCVEVLAAELGVEPAPETSALYYALLHSDPAPPSEIARQPCAVCPRHRAARSLSSPRASAGRRHALRRPRG